MASSSFRTLALTASRSLHQRAFVRSSPSSPASSWLQAATGAGASSSRRSGQGLMRFASSTTIEPAEQAPQIVPTAEEFEKDPQLAGLGYPQLPLVSRQLRPPLANWWDRQERIQFGEVLPESDDALSMWAPDVHKMPASTAFAQLALMSGVLASFAGLIFLVAPGRPSAPREYPYDGLVKELSGTDDQEYAAVVKTPASSEDEEEEDE